jgi:zinc transporter ZupT
LPLLWCGLVAAKFRNVLQYFFAFSAGALIAITFFDVLPETYPHVPWKMALAMIFGVLLIFGLTAINKI